MRLTLRTLLAYLDRTLDEPSQRELQERFHNSAVAMELAARIQRVTSNPQLPSPSFDAFSPNEDPNTVAEYLGNVLSPELTADLESRCITSDVHLAEVAACHRILASFEAGQPADIPSALRERIAKLPLPSPAALGQALEGDASSADGKGLSVGERATAASPRSLNPAPAAPLPDLAATLAAATRAIRENQAPGKQGHETVASGRATATNNRQQMEHLAPLLASRGPSRIAQMLAGLGLLAAFLFVLSQSLQPLIQLSQQRAADEAKVQRQQPPRSSSDAPAVPSAATDEPAPEPLPASAVSSSQGTPSVPNPQPSRENTPQPEDASKTSASTPPVVSEPTAAEESREAPLPPKPSPAVVESTPLGEGAASGVTAANASRDAVAKVMPVQVMDDGGLLLGANLREDRWDRLGKGAEIEEKQVVVCPPAFRARVALGSGAEAELIGPCEVSWSRSQDPENEKQELIELEVLAGKLIVTSRRDRLHLLMRSSAAKEPLSVVVPEQDSSLVIKVFHRRPPGANLFMQESFECLFELTPLDSVLGFKLVQGDARQTPTSLLQKGKMLWIRTGNEPVEFASSDDLSWLKEPRAEPSSVNLAQQLASSDDVLQKLFEIADQGPPEEAGLAVVVLLSLKRFDVLFGPQGALRNVRLRESWPVIVDSLLAILDRSEPLIPADQENPPVFLSDLICRVLTQLEKEEVAKKLTSLLIGYSPDDLEDPAKSELVLLLNDQDLAVRVLATEVLQQILGERVDYVPAESNDRRRERSYARLRRLLAGGKLRWFNEEHGEIGIPR